MSNSKCHLCGGQLQVFVGYPQKYQVTSDCRPWQGHGKLAFCNTCSTVQKEANENWLNETQQIYDEYNIYSQSKGFEQLSFDSESGAGKARSHKILNWLSTNVTLPIRGQMLDIGCGNGSFLRAFGQAFPGWQLVGTELNSRHRDIIEAQPNVLRLHTGPLDEIQERFDLIVMIHALEHIPDPRFFLERLHRLLKPTGLLMIQVPDLLTSPFDILIADHCTHFSQHSLNKTIGNAGYTVYSVVNTCVPKELSLLATVSKKNPNIQAVNCHDYDVVTQHIHWLSDLLTQAHATPSPLGIFGSSIASTWLASALAKQPSFFVDEDPARAGQRHLGLPILAVDEVPAEVPVLMPMRHDLADSIAKRLLPSLPSLVTPPKSSK